MNKFKIIITDDAKDDIRNIVKYIKTKNAIAALNLAKTFQKTFILLSNFPSAGKNKQYIKDETILIYTVKKRFLIAYYFKDNRITILRILSSYQDICALL